MGRGRGRRGAGDSRARLDAAPWKADAALRAARVGSYGAARLTGDCVPPTPSWLRACAGGGAGQRASAGGDEGESGGSVGAEAFEDEAVVVNGSVAVVAEGEEVVEVVGAAL